MKGSFLLPPYGAFDTLFPCQKRPRGLEHDYFLPSTAVPAPRLLDSWVKGGAQGAGQVSYLLGETAFLYLINTHWVGVSSATPSTISPLSALLVHIGPPSTPPPVFAVFSFISWPEQQFYGKHHESILLFPFVARDPDCPQGSFFLPNPPNLVVSSKYPHNS